MKRRFLPIRLIRVIRGCFSQGQKLPGRWWRAEDRAIGSSKGHSHPAKKYICPVFMFGHLSGNWIPDVLIAWNEPDRRSDGEKCHVVMTASRFRAGSDCGRKAGSASRRCRFSCYATTLRARLNRRGIPIHHDICPCRNSRRRRTANRELSAEGCNR